MSILNVCVVSGDEETEVTSTPEVEVEESNEENEIIVEEGKEEEIPDKKKGERKKRRGGWRESYKDPIDTLSYFIAYYKHVCDVVLYTGLKT